jgi:hypothetical protein
MLRGLDGNQGEFDEWFARVALEEKVAGAADPDLSALVVTKMAATRRTPGDDVKGLADMCHRYAALVRHMR